MIKTAIENKQNLIIEGCYVPFDWSKDFEKEYLDDIRYYFKLIYCCQQAILSRVGEDFHFYKY